MTDDPELPPVPDALASALAQRAPAFWRWASADAPPRAAVSPHGDHGTLVVRGVHLASALEPAAEATLLAGEAIPDGAAHAHVYGTGTALIEAALARAATVTVVGLTPAATVAELAHRAPGWATDPRVTLLAPDEAPLPSPPWVAASAELRLAAPSRLRDALLLELLAPFQRAYTADVRAARGSRARANRARFPGDGDVRSLFGTGRRWAAIAAGGPSLLDGLDLVAARGDQVSLIATTTALAALEQRGLRPDAAVMVDHQAVIVEHLARVRDPSTLSGVPLVYAVDVAPDLPARWPGPRLACRLDLPGYDEATTGWTCASLFCSGTVTHTAVDLAVRMGAEDVVLLGADFGFPGGRAHATEWSWTPDVATRRLTTDGVDGAPLPTDPNLLGYRFDLERYIADRPSIRFWNASRIGARIAGARSYPP